jgi:WXG100 family type VII secretion target
MAAESAVDRAAMAQAAVQVEDAVAQIRGQQGQLAGFHGDLMAGWQGEAAAAFTGAYQAFNADFTQVLTALQGIHEKLTATRTRYVATEEAQTAAANRVRGLLNH